MEDGGTAELFGPEYRNPLRRPLPFRFPRPCLLGFPSKCWGWGAAVFLPFPVSDARCRPRNEETAAAEAVSPVLAARRGGKRVSPVTVPHVSGCTGLAVRADSQGNGATGRSRAGRRPPARCSAPLFPIVPDEGCPRGPGGCQSKAVVTGAEGPRRECGASPACCRPRLALVAAGGGGTAGNAGQHAPAGIFC